MLNEPAELNIRRPEGMRVFRTSYATGGAFYGAAIQAENITLARQIAIARGLNERIEGEGPSFGDHYLLGMIDAGRWSDALHLSAFMCFIGLSAGALSPREVLGDRGLVHELIHLSTPLNHHPVAEDKVERAELIERVRSMALDFAHRIPGWPTVETVSEPRTDGGRTITRAA